MCIGGDGGIKCTLKVYTCLHKCVYDDNRKKKDNAMMWLGILENIWELEKDGIRLEIKTIGQTCAR